MAVRFKRSYHDRKETIARRRKTVFKVLLILFSFQIIFSLFAATIRINSISMEPGLKKGNVLMYSPVVYGFKIKILNTQLPEIKKPARGDLVVFTPPYVERKSGAFSVFSGIVKFLTFGKIQLDSLTSEPWDQKPLVKRIIAIPGDTVRMIDYRVSVKPEGTSFFLSEFEVLDKDYDIQTGSLPAKWDNSLPFSGNMDAVTLKEKQYFVLGDNRMMSSDSISWGMLPEENIEGLVVLKYWPLNQFQFYP